MNASRPTRTSMSSAGRSGVVAGVGLALVGAWLGAAPGSADAAGLPAASAKADVRVAQIKLSGVDPAVARSAGKGAGKGVRTLTATRAAGAKSSRAASAKDRDLAPAVATTVRIARPADLVALSATGGFAPGSQAQVRVKEAGRWGPWTTLEIDDDHAPDPGTAEAQEARQGSAPLLTHNATTVQVRLDTPKGKLPPGLDLTLVDSPVVAADKQAGRVRAMAASMPAIATRAQWGADESWRRRAPSYTGNIKIGFVHHTASTSNYTMEQTAKQIRAIYAYHTRSLKHSDIDYNFMVDRFGRLWEGRAGGIDKAVEGGHTAGFNSNSFAVSALGDFDKVRPAAAEMSAIKENIARLFAWKLGMYGINPGQNVSVVSAGFIRKTKYAKGVTANLPAMSSHQTVNYTDCPGRYLQAELASMRALAASYSNLLLAAPSPEVPSFVAGSRSGLAITSSAAGTTAWRLDIMSPCSDTPVRSISGQADTAGPISMSWDLKDSAGSPVLPATYTLRLNGTTLDGAPVAEVSGMLTIAPAPGGAVGPCANATRVAGASPGATSVSHGTRIAPGARTVVLTGEATAGPAALAAGVAAAPLARKLGAPLLVTPAAGLAAEVRADIIARAATEVVVVGSGEVVSDAVLADLSAAGIPVTRLAGATDADTAAAVAARIGASASAVLVAPAINPGLALAGAGLAAAHGVPVLLANAGEVPPATVAALATIGAPNVVVAVGGELPDPVLAAALGARTSSRVSGADARSGALAVAGVWPSPPAAAVLASDAPTAWASLPALLAAGQPVLYTAGAEVSAEAISYFTGRAGLTSVTSANSEVELTDRVIGGVSRLLLGLPLTGPGAAPVPPPTVVAAPPTPAATATSTRKVGWANAAPEPVKRRAVVTVSAKVTAKYSDKKWRSAPDGVTFTVQFRKSGARKWVTKATGTTASGRATAKATATQSGRWRVKVGGKYSASDLVKVRR